MNELANMFIALLGNDITEAYDEVEDMLNRTPNLPNDDLRRALHAKLTTAKDALFAARVLIDEASA